MATGRRTTPTVPNVVTLISGSLPKNHTHDREGEISRREEKCPNDLNPKDPRPGFNRRTERRRFLEPPTEADLDEQRLYLIPATLTRGPNSHRLPALPTDVAGAQADRLSRHRDTSDWQLNRTEFRRHGAALHQP